MPKCLTCAQEYTGDEETHRKTYQHISEVARLSLAVVARYDRCPFCCAVLDDCKNEEHKRLLDLYRKLLLGKEEQS